MQAERREPLNEAQGQDVEAERRMKEAEDVDRQCKADLDALQHAAHMAKVDAHQKHAQMAAVDAHASRARRHAEAQAEVQREAEDLARHLDRVAGVDNFGQASAALGRRTPALLHRRQSRPALLHRRQSRTARGEAAEAAGAADAEVQTQGGGESGQGDRSGERRPGPIVVMCSSYSFASHMFVVCFR